MNSYRCKQCNCEYDRYLGNCPECGNVNEEYKKNVGQKTFLSVTQQIVFILLGTVFFILLAFCFELLFNAIEGGKTDEETKIKVLGLSRFIVYGILLAIYLFFAVKYRDKVFFSFKKWFNYLGAGIAFGVLISVTLIATYLLKKYCGLKDSENEIILGKIISTYPIPSLIFFGIVGPIVEELTYRVGLFSLINRYKRWLAYVITIVIFTLVHIQFDSKDLANEMLNVPLYLFGAAVLTVTYDYFGLTGSLLCHILNNVVVIIIQIAS